MHEQFLVTGCALNILVTRCSRFFYNNNIIIPNICAARYTETFIDYVINFHNRVPKPDAYR